MLRWQTHSVHDASEGARASASARDLEQAGERDAPIKLVAYDEAWPGRFAAEAQRLGAIVPGLELHHVGSTAVPGIAAKPVIDMMALTDDPDAHVPAIVEEGGYQFPVAYNAMLKGRRWLCFPSAAHRTHHLHLVTDRSALERHLRFRDALRSDAVLAREYEQLKCQLARRFATDREAYTAAKTEFIEVALR